MNDDCKRFDGALLDIAYGELAPAEAEVLRMHAERCAECRASLESILLTRKLMGQMPLLEPDRSIDAAILAAATSKPLHPGGAALHVASPSLLDRLRSVLLAPALVTATAAALVLVLSLFFAEQSAKPAHEKAEETFGGSIAPSQLDSPAAVREQAMRAAKTSELEALPSASAQVAGGPSPPSDLTDLTRAEKRAFPAGQAGSIDALAGRKGATREEGTGDLGTGFAVAALAGGGDAKGAARSTDRALGTAAGVPEARGRRSDGFGGLDDEMPSAAPAGASAAPKKKSASFDSESEEAKIADAFHSEPGNAYFERGMEAYRRGDCDTAVSALRSAVSQPSVSPTGKATALHHLARCERRRGRCSEALVFYSELLDRYPAYGDRGDASLEAAQCHRRLGHIAEARALLRDLAERPGWEDKAATELERLDRESAR